MTSGEKPFDCVRMMRELRDDLDRQMTEITNDERVAFIDGNAERTARDLGLPPATDPQLAAERARTAREARTRAA